MSYVCVMPWVDRVWRADCLDSCDLDVFQVDNSQKNLGVPRSWNIGIDLMRSRDADWLIVMSSAVRFGKPRGKDFLDLLEERADHHVIQPLATFGWHLVAFRRDAVEAAGRFDENFFPGYYEDIDYSIRLYHAGMNVRGGYACDVMDAGMAHSIKECGITVDDRALRIYFYKKWGAFPGASWDDYYSRPFDRFPLDYWPTPKVRT